jgi:uncharacterized protein (DUF1697 family)
MEKYIGLLRGINVGGKNKIKMVELIKILKGIGLENIRTYIQSGNIVFQCVERDYDEIALEISQAICDSYGFSPITLVLGLKEFSEAIKNNPFPEAENEPKALHFYFLEQVPQNPNIAALENIKRESECYKLVGKVFYLYAPEGIGRSKLAAKVENALGVVVTARNWRSVNKIYSLATS